MNEQEFKDRTKVFALQIITLIDRLPKTPSASVIGRQLMRSATSIGANYRAACRAKSVADMISKLSVAEEEADESMYCLEILKDCETIDAEGIDALIAECNEIISLLVASIKTLRKRAQ